MISLYQCKNYELNKILDFYYKDQLIKDTFGGIRVDRVLNCDYGFTIKKNDIDIGFILLLNENNCYNIDMGIIKKYRNKGYSSKCLKLLKNEFNNFNVSVNKNNIAANKSISKVLKLDKSYSEVNIYK